MATQLLPSQHTPNLPSAAHRGVGPVLDVAPDDHPDVLPVGSERRSALVAYPGSGMPGEPWESVDGAPRVGLRRGV